MENKGGKVVGCSIDPEGECYVCRNVYDGIQVRRHEEHIIQNAIGGRLTSDKVLCESCGGKLGELIDTPFCSELALFNILHETSRDRESGKSGARVGILTKVTPERFSDTTIYRLCEDYRIIPNRPIYFKDDENKSVTIIASTLKQASDFSKSAQIRQLAEAGYSIRQEDDVGRYAERVVLEFESGSEAVARGVAKIALEFAINSGVELRFLDEFIASFLDFSDIEKLRLSVLQYYPITDEEKIYEIGKYKHEDWHPNHQITLFSNRSDLYCYVEIFGAIQKYIHLSSRYGGKKILIRYTQRVKSWEFNPADWTGGPKDLHQSAAHFGIEVNGRSWIDVEKDVLYQARIRPYSVDPEIQVEKVQTIMQSLIQYTVSNIKGIAVVDELIEKSKSADQVFGISIVRRLKADPIAALEMIRKSYSRFRVMSNMDCCPVLARQVAPDVLERYCRFKLYESLCSVAKQEDFMIHELHTDLDSYMH
jgi:hypothetical protein